MPANSDLPSLGAGLLSEPQLTAALKTLELTVRRKLDGVLQGEHLGLIPGPGSEPGEARAYQPGDDIRRMEWSVTARTTQPHVRQMIADRELETWLVVDASASLDFGTVNCTKRDLAVAAAAAIVHLTSGGGNRHGAIVVTGDQVVRIPARAGRAHAQNLLKALATTTRASSGVRGDLHAGIEALRRPQRRRGLAVVVSDFLGLIDWERSLRAIGAHHELLAVEVLDPRDLTLPDVGAVSLADAESGEVRDITVTPAVRRDFAAAARDHQLKVHRTVRSCGGPVLSLQTDRDWITDTVKFVAQRRRGLAAGVG
ncbi:MAG: DUF58 domain-containing protein [Gordonia sp.]|uniref:DUF58 domain-containing protein n=1 Tax=Gordonia sp. (in: high G+C Gram-positive bacteria) TaxID=84139 RepID=UPI000C4F197D|nr:DUF58 domain-containing protein [Gordonia sp. (in: high G+C Gram-positive bacteria)]MAU82799.1 DUF58 domain-containing protein [Gordonia sp. (in: high G+C Gram-positive bacteria)]